MAGEDAFPSFRHHAFIESALANLAQSKDLLESYLSKRKYGRILCEYVEDPIRALNDRLAGLPASDAVSTVHAYAVFYHTVTASFPHYVSYDELNDILMHMHTAIARVYSWILATGGS